MYSNPPALSLALPRFSLVEAAVAALEKGIDSGLWTSRLPGERALCEQLRISRPTLRKALKILENEEQVKVRAGRQRYLTSIRNPDIPTSRKQIIGMLSPLPLRALPPFVLFWIAELRATLALSGYQLEFHERPGSVVQNPGRLLQRLVQGSPSSVWISLLSTPAVQQWFQKNALPCLIAGSCGPQVSLPSVDIDHRAVCRHAVGVFRRAGHSRLALILPAGNHQGDTDSETGFREASTDQLAPVVLRHSGTADDIIHQLNQALQSPAPPTGLLVARSAHVLTVMTFLLRRGFQVPFKIAVISRDDDAFLNFITPRIARYTSNPVIFARHVSNGVLKLARSGSIPPRPIRLMPKFLPGESV